MPTNRPSINRGPNENNNQTFNSPFNNNIYNTTGAFSVVNGDNDSLSYNGNAFVNKIASEGG
jgi:hypothetical protein